MEDEVKKNLMATSTKTSEVEVGSMQSYFPMTHLAATFLKAKTQVESSNCKHTTQLLTYL